LRRHVHDNYSIEKESTMKGIRITLLCIAASLIIAGAAFAQPFPQHYAKTTDLTLWTWIINWGGVPVAIPMIFPNILSYPELPPIAPNWYGVVSGNRVRWYFRGPIRKPISDLLLCVRGMVFKEEFPQADGYVAQTGRNNDGSLAANFLADQPHIAAWAEPFDYQYAEPFTPPPPKPERGSWNPYYLTARILPLVGVQVPLARIAPPPPPPGTPAIGAIGAQTITLINGFEICLLIRLPVSGIGTGADWDGDALNPLYAIVPNDLGNELEVALATGDMITVQIDILPGHQHNIYLSPTESIKVKYITPNP
jgi:hypothetical protein